MLHKDDDERVLGLSDADVLSCDRFKVAQVVRNFVSNAIKFTPTGGKVTIHACFKGDIDIITIIVLSYSSHFYVCSLSFYYLHSIPIVVHEVLTFLTRSLPLINTFPFKVNGSSLKNVDKKEKQKQRSSFFASIGEYNHTLCHTTYHTLSTHAYAPSHTHTSRHPS